MEVINKGSVESLLVPLRDRLGNLQTLADVTNLRFDTEAKADGSAIQTNAVAIFDADSPMTAICEIDSSLSGYAAGVYLLYLKYTTGSEAPRLGPVEFRIEE